MIYILIIWIAFPGSYNPTTTVVGNFDKQYCEQLALQWKNISRFHRAVCLGSK